MEVIVARADNVPDGCMLALTAGQSRRLAPLVSKQKFAFSTEAAAAAASEGGPGMKVEVLMIKGIARIDAAQLKAGVIGAGHTKKGHKLEVPLKIGSELAMFDRPIAELPPMRVALSVRPVSEKHGRDPTRSREAAVRAKARVVSPGVEGKDVGPQPARSLMKEAAPRRASPSPNPNPKQPVRGKHTIALEARNYLEDHHIFNFIEDMMRLLVKEKPIDPWGCIAGLFPSGGKDKSFNARQNTGSTIVPPSEATLTGCTRESWFTTSGRQELAAMAEEGEEEESASDDRHAAWPEASPTSGAQLLRKLARDQLADALGSGHLQRALRQVQQDQMQQLRQRTRETLLRAGMCGTLATQLESLWNAPAEVVGEDVHGLGEEEPLEEEEESDTDPAQIERVLPGHRLDRALGDFTPTSERAFSCASEGDGTARHEALSLLERAKAKESDTDPTQIQRIVPGHRLDHALSDFTPTSDRTFSCISEGDGTARHEALSLLERANVQARTAGLPQRPTSTASTAALSADSGGTLASAAREEARNLLACVGDLMATAKAAPGPAEQGVDDKGDGESGVIVRSNSFQTEGSAALSEARRLMEGVDLTGLQEDGVLVRSNSFSTALSVAQSEARNVVAQVAFHEVAPSEVVPAPPPPVADRSAEEAEEQGHAKEVPEEAGSLVLPQDEKLAPEVSDEAGSVVLLPQDEKLAPVPPEVPDEDEKLAPEVPGDAGSLVLPQDEKLAPEVPDYAGSLVLPQDEKLAPPDVPGEAGSLELPQDEEPAKEVPDEAGSVVLPKDEELAKEIPDEAGSIVLPQDEEPAKEVPDEAGSLVLPQDEEPAKEIPDEAGSIVLPQDKLVPQASDGGESLMLPQDRVPPGASLTEALSGWEGEGSRPATQGTRSVASVPLDDAQQQEVFPPEDAAEQEAVDTMLHQAVSEFARSAAGSLERMSVGPSEQMAYTMANSPDAAATGSVKTASHLQTTTVAQDNAVQDLVPSLFLGQLGPEGGTPSVRSLVSYAHTAVALAHETVQLSEQGLSVSMKVRNVDYFALVADTSLLSAFEATTKQAIAAEAGEGIFPEYVVLQLSAGSVIIDATIVPPIGFSAKELQSKLSLTGALPQSMVVQLSQIERIETVKSGPLVICGFSVEESDTRAAIPVVTRQVEEASRRRQEEDEAQRLIEEELRKRREEERLLQQQQAAELARQREETERAAAEAEEAAAKAVEEELRKRREEEAAQLQRAEEERRQAEEAAAARRREEEEAAAQLVREEQARKQHEEEEAVRRRWAEQEEAERLTDEEAAKAAAELLWRQQLEEAEEQRARALACCSKQFEEDEEDQVDLRAQPPEASEADGKADSEVVAEEHARLEAEEAEKAEYARLQAEEAEKALAAERARLEAEEAEKALAAEQARLQAEEEEKALAAEQARLQAEEAEKALAAEQARLQAEEEAEKALAAEQARLQAEEAAQEAQQRQLEMAAEEVAWAEERATRTPETQESRLQAEKEAAERRRQAEREVEEAEARTRLQALMRTQEVQSRYNKEVGDRQDQQAREAQRIQEEMQKLSQELETRNDADDWTTGTLTPPAMKPVSSSDLEEINVGDRIEVINSLYLDQEGVEVLAGWTGIVQEMNDGDAVILFFGMPEGRYVLKEDFGNLIVSKADISVTSCSESLLRQEVGQAMQQNEALRAQNAALKLELDRLLGSCTPSSATPPVTGGTRRG